MINKNIKRTRLSQSEIAEFEKNCMAYWENGYDDHAIAHLTGKRLDMVQNTLWKMFSRGNGSVLECARHERTKFIVSKCCTIKGIGNWSVSDFYEATKDSNGKIVLSPLDK